MDAILPRFVVRGVLRVRGVQESMHRTFSCLRNTDDLLRTQ